MFFKNLFEKYYSQFRHVRLVHNYIYKMDKAYCRHVNDSDQFELSFKYVNQELRVNRQFNFNRKLSETLETFLSRVSTNVEKIVTKKNKKKKNAEETVLPSVSAALFLNNVEMPKETICNNVFQPGNDISLSILDSKYKVVINSPYVDKIELPDAMLAGFHTYLSKFEAVYTNKKSSDFIWYKSNDKKTWTEVSKGYIYVPSNEDIGYYLKLQCTPRNSESEGPSVEIVSESPVEAGPGKCPFEDRHQFTKTRCEGDQFRVVTYNILADLYCDSDYTREVLHPYCPPYALKMDYRKQLILKELIGYNADIICLQEVDRSVFKYDLESTLNHLGYRGFLTLKGEEVAEGLGFFYRTDRFKHINTEKFVYAKRIAEDPLFADIWEKINSNAKLSERILNRSTTLQVNVIDSLERDETLVIANTHLYFHPDADHIRLLHGGIAIRYLESVIKNLKQQYSNKRISLIFCGDFNSSPDSGIYKLYTTGMVPKDIVDYQSNKEEQIENVELRQNFKLDSACGIPHYTNFTSGFSDCLDWIYYEKTNLKVTQVVPLPSHEDVIQHTALPSVVFPSDHIALVSDLKWL